jgi:hypothetical protein
MNRPLLAAIVLAAVSVPTVAYHRDVQGSAPPACNVQGVWERVATVTGGKRTEFTGAKQRKIVTKKHFMWLVSASRRDTLPLRTALDSAVFMQTGGGYGTYSVKGGKYTESIDLFVDPRLEGKSLTSSCRVQGNQWFHTFLPGDIDLLAPGAPVPDSSTEIWRRVE